MSGPVEPFTDDMAAELDQIARTLAAALVCDFRAGRLRIDAPSVHATFVKVLGPTAAVRFRLSVVALTPAEIAAEERRAMQAAASDNLPPPVPSTGTLH